LAPELVQGQAPVQQVLAQRARLPVARRARAAQQERVAALQAAPDLVRARRRP